MDWFSWLSKTGLDPSLVYEYGSVFAHNELEEDDVSYFNHEFLQSMGISIAKHRLEILKLARKEKGGLRPRPMSRIFVVIKRTKTCFSKYFRAWIMREEAALAIVPRPDYSARWKNGKLRRNKKVVGAKHSTRAPLLITNGSPTKFLPSSRINSLSSPMVVHGRGNERKMDDDYDEYWSSALEEIKWDAMFHNLKPT